MTNFVFTERRKNVAGINLGGIVDWAPAYTFKDIFKMSRNWVSQDVTNSLWDDGRTLPVDSNGWVTSLLPGQSAVTVMMTNSPGTYPIGDYILTYDGSGTFDVNLGGSVTSSIPGRAVVNITGSALVVFSILTTDPNNYMRNIKLFMPGMENNNPTQVFHPDFLASLQDFTTLRFMDWGKTNFSPLVTWSQRTTLNSSTQTGANGVAVEHMIDLCNTLNKDMWICIPEQADDDFVINLATLIKQSIYPNIKVYIEYSNEVWNFMFTAVDYMTAQGVALGLSTNPFYAGQRFYSQRSQEIHSIFYSIFPLEHKKLVRVVCGQFVNPFIARIILDWDKAAQAENSSNVSSRFDAYGVAPYFGASFGSTTNASATLAMTEEQIIQACEDQSTDNHLVYTSQQKTNTVDRGIKLIAYEGGQHLVEQGASSDTDPLTVLFGNVNRNAGMRAMYLDDLNRWTKFGGELFVAFAHVSTYGRSGNWGLKETLTQLDANSPKQLGIQDWANLTP